MLQYSFPPCSFVQGKSEKLALEETAFEEIERDFQEVLNELSGDKSLEKFRIEYEKLHAVMKKSYDNEKRLMAKCRELNAEIVVNSAKVATALKVSQDDQTTIASLKKVSDLVETEPRQSCHKFILYLKHPSFFTLAALGW